MTFLLRKLLRYAGVSLVATVTSLTVLGVLVGTRAASPVWANVVATAAGTVPSFELNRRWVWHKTGDRSIAAEILPFCALSFAGLVLSTLAVAAAARWANDTGFSGSLRTVAVELANVTAFGALWVIQFVVLDRLLFVAPSQVARSPVVSE
jgi:putative flippase GtrA